VIANPTSVPVNTNGLEDAIMMKCVFSNAAGSAARTKTAELR
jgi:hypothetical protein